MDTVQKGTREMSEERVSDRVPDRTYEVDGVGDVEVYVYQYRPRYNWWGQDVENNMVTGLTRVRGESTDVNGNEYYPTGGMTIVSAVHRAENGNIENFSLGVTVCSVKEKFNAGHGRRIATARAISGIEASEYPIVISPEHLPNSLQNNVTNVFNYWTVKAS
jgi:hypothetical protein